MINQPSEVLNKIIENYTGVSLIERLSLFAKSPEPSIAVKASIEALKYLSSHSWNSPHIEEIFLPIIERFDNDPIHSKYKNIQWLEHLRVRQARKSEELNADNFYHESDIDNLKEVIYMNVVNKQFTDAQNMINSSSLNSKSLQLSEISAQIGILQGNYSLTINQDKKIESFISSALSNEIYNKRLIKVEIETYFRIKFLIIFASFLKKEYDETIQLCSDVIKLSLKANDDNIISSLDILNDAERFGSFITKDEIIFSYNFSVLLTQTPVQLNQTLTEKVFNSFQNSDLDAYKSLFQSITTANFKQLFIQLDERFDPFAKLNVFIKKVWESLRLELRYKSYELYFSLVIKVSAEHLSNKLNIEINQLIKEVKGFIKDKELEFFFDEQENIFLKAKYDKHEVFLNKLTAATENIEIIESKIKDSLISANEKAKNIFADSSQRKPLAGLKGIFG
ncbi:hypothetical protein WICMUC_003535 [Wickerhamomyces mucosus]|uniref:PCI domain-containing protein n=1 Tax=Wickerhamomyces mucosus TaxID=1378264 RepID=A0A9P8PLK3_9ASCO|nr:hypothetical protein WICMUC_003535 [Wickerhamomyces mucosus]